MGWGPEKGVFHGTESRKGDLLQDGVQKSGAGVGGRGGLSLNRAQKRKVKGFQSMGSLERGLLPGTAHPGKTFFLGKRGSRKLAVFLGRPFSQDSQKKKMAPQDRVQEK